MKSPIPFSAPPLPDLADVAEAILFGGFTIVTVLFVLSVAWEMMRRR